MMLSLGLLGVFRGTAIEGSIISAQLVSTTGVSLILLFAFLLDLPSSIELALVLGLPAAVAVAALTRRE